MDTLLPILKPLDYDSLILLWLLGSNTISLLLLIRERVLNAKLKTHLAESPTSLAKQKSDAMLSEAVSKSQEIVEKSQEQALKIVAKSESVVSDLVQNYDLAIANLEKTFENHLKERLDVLAEKNEQVLTQTLKMNEDRLADFIKTEMVSAKKVIDTYKSTQMAKLDQNITEIAERVVELVLSRKALGDQDEVIRDALDQAKSERRP